MQKCKELFFQIYESPLLHLLGVYFYNSGFILVNCKIFLP